MENPFKYLQYKKYSITDVVKETGLTKYQLTARVRVSDEVRNRIFIFRRGMRSGRYNKKSIRLFN